MGAKESVLQSSILSYLTHLCIQTGRMGPSVLYGLTLPAKLPKGSFLAIEVKLLESAVTQEQLFFLSNVAESGNTAILARSFDDVRLVLERKVQPDAATGIYIPSGALRLRK